MTLGFNDTITSWKVVAMNRFEDRKVLVTGAGILRGAHTHEASLDHWNQVIGSFAHPSMAAYSASGAFITGTEIRVDGGAHQ
jgi:NADP-dependent 3-hydroxy acid dehydrogenase YdfG